MLDTEWLIYKLLCIALAWVVLWSIPFTAKSFADYAIVERCCQNFDCIGTVTQPILTDRDGKDIESVLAGQMVFIAVNVFSCHQERTPFVGIIQAINTNNVTVYLQFQSGQLNEHGESQIGVSWVPETAGQYQLKTFLISDFVHPHSSSTSNINTVTIS